MKQLPETINSVDDADSIIIKYNLRLEAHLQVGGHLIFRGQGRWEYELLPTISRNVRDINKLIEVEKNIIEEFECELKNNGLLAHIRSEYLNKPFHKEWSWLQQAQHYGLPTRLLDWTILTKMALFFAVENPDNDDSDGQFWIFITPDIIMDIDSNLDNYLDGSPFELKYPLFFNSGFLWNDNVQLQIGERRKRQQMGRFSILPHTLSLTPIEKLPKTGDNLIRIKIPKDSKRAIRDELENMGITRASVYLEEVNPLEDIVRDLKSKYGL